MEDKKNNTENGAATQPGEQQSAARPENGTARILARAGEAFDAAEASRALHESGLKDASRLEPTDQSFVFAAPGEEHANFVADDDTLHPVEPVEAKATAPVSQGVPHLAVDLTEAPDPDISWRSRPLPPVSDPLPMGVLQGDAAESGPKSIYDTETGLFGLDDSWFMEAEAGEGEASELVLGVKFREYGSVYFFRAGTEKIRPGGKILVESENGLSLGEVISARRLRLPLPKIRTAEGEELEIKPILGLPGPEDIAAAADNRILASGARLFCKECIRERNLDMKLVDVEVLHDRSKIIFYFTAPTRIDFRELVKDLVRNYRTRIELRQIGVRHETQMLGALGNCGMACCCRRYLRRFAPVTIKMAKEQNLFLNPAKLSGICGRLLCCLANEQENYEEFHRNCPKIGKKYQTTRGTMKVLRANLFRQSIVAVAEGGEEEEFLLDSWHELEPQRLEMREHKDGRAQNDGNFEAHAAEPQAENGESPELAALLDDESPAPERGQERPRPEHARRDNKRGGRGKRGGQGKRPAHDGENAEKNSDPAPRANADKSIFGLPGAQFNKNKD